MRRPLACRPSPHRTGWRGGEERRQLACASVSRGSRARSPAGGRPRPAAPASSRENRTVEGALPLPPRLRRFRAACWARLAHVHPRPPVRGHRNLSGVVADLAARCHFSPAGIARMRAAAAWRRQRASQQRSGRPRLPGWSVLHSTMLAMLQSGFVTGPASRTTTVQPSGLSEGDGRQSWVMAAPSVWSMRGRDMDHRGARAARRYRGLPDAFPGTSHT